MQTAFICVNCTLQFMPILRYAKDLGISEGLLMAFFCQFTTAKPSQRFPIILQIAICSLANMHVYMLTTNMRRYTMHIFTIYIHVLKFWRAVNRGERPPQSNGSGLVGTSRAVGARWEYYLCECRYYLCVYVGIIRVFMYVLFVYVCRNVCVGL